LLLLLRRQLGIVQGGGFSGVCGKLAAESAHDFAVGLLVVEDAGPAFRGFGELGRGGLTCK
jgi:hypothetical protein